jgi:purine-binding chemotaxis protein CheW
LSASEFSPRTPEPRGNASLICRARARLCALPLEHVIETMRPLPIEALAGMPSFVRGLSVIRGTPIPVVDAGVLLGTDEGAGSTRFVTLRTGQRQVALSVEEVLGVRSFPAASIADLPPLLRDAGSEVISALGLLDADLLFVLRAARILSDEAWRALGEGGTAT